MSRRRLAALLPFLLASAACVPGGAPAGDLAAGRQLYLSRGCAACHGPEGAGDGPASRATRRPPRDLRAADSYLRPPGEASIAEVIASGLESDRGGMPGQSFLPEAERRTIARYVLSLVEPASPKGP